MPAKIRFRLTLVLVVVIFVIFSILIVLSLQNIQASLAKAQLAETISSIMYERRILSDEYIATGSERAKSQWIAKQSELQNKLESSKSVFVAENEKELFDTISTSMNTTGDIFAQIIDITENKNSELTPQAQLEVKDRLTSQLAVRAEEAVSAVSTLVDINNKGIETSFNKIMYFFSASSTVLLIMLSGILRRLYKRATELFEEKTRITSILNEIGDGVFVIDRDWNILIFNNSAEKISGWSKKDVIGKPVRTVMKFINETTRKENLGFIEETMITGETKFMSENTILIKKDGSEIPVGDSAAPYKDDAGNIKGAILIFRDLSKEKEASMLKSDFAYASHQLRTPIGKALWLIESVINSKHRGSTEAEHIKEAYRAMLSVLKLSDELIEVSNIDQGREVPELKKVNLKSLVHECVKKLKDEIELKKLVVDLPSLTEEKEINTDKNMLGRILSTLLDNAIIYNRIGGRIVITTVIENGNLLLSIKDSGEGITPDQEPLVFTKFFRGSNFDNVDIPGAGLGLYICREYVRLLNGSIWFESNPRDGTIFFVKLPV